MTIPTTKQMESWLTLTEVRASNLAMSYAVERVDIGIEMMLEMINNAVQELLVESLSRHAWNAQDMQDDVART